jgi:hypothetical protein
MHVTSDDGNAPVGGAPSGITVDPPPKGWRGWRVVRALGVFVGWLKRCAARLKPADKRTVGEVRMAEKEHQKAVRRELRGLPATPDPSEVPASRSS